MFKKKLSLYLFIIFFITIIFAARFFQIKNDQEEQIIQLVQKQTSQIDQWILTKKNHLEKLSKNLEKVDYDKEIHLELMKKTNKLMDTNSIFSGFTNGKYFDTQGYWIENFDPRTRPWYIETLKNNKTTISGPMYYNDISGQKISWWSISSIFLKDNKPFGVLGSEILPDMMNKHLKTNFTNNLENLFLFHKDTGIIVSAINRDIELQTIQTIFSKEAFKKFSQLKNKISFSNHGKKKIAYIKSLKEAPWILCAIKK